MLENLYITTCVSIISFVYIRILSEEPILNWWFRFGLKYEKTFFYKPIFGCVKCFSGQVILFIYLFNWFLWILLVNINPNFNYLFLVIPKLHNMNYSVFQAVFYVCITVLQSLLIDTLYNKISTYE